MKVAFFSNYLNHHQLPLSLTMDRLTGGNYTFVATTPIPQARLDFGYKDMNHKYPFVLCTYDSVENQEKAMELALTADVIITGSAPEKYTVERIKRGKLTFRYSERPYKEGVAWHQIPRRLVSTWLHHSRYNFRPLYMLCASAYTAYDHGRFGAYRGKSYRWGYFPEVKDENLDELFAQKYSKRKVTLLWVARLIPLKHPEMALRLAETLKVEGYDFELQIIGNGLLEESMRRTIAEKDLEDCVKMLGSMTPDEVRMHMEQADIFLFTSDFNEGWGAVLNESMNSGCAVVASHAIGSVGFLIHHGENGLIFRNEDQQDFNEKVKQLLDKPALRERLGRAAYQTLKDEWNAEVAAKRLLELSEYLAQGGKGSPFVDGPCSMASRMSNEQAGRWLCK